MLRITMNKSADSAKKYYCEAYYKEGHSAQLNYYVEKQEAIGRWGGMAAEKLELTGDIAKEDFAKLCDNIHPVSGNTLTGRNDIDRTVGYDFTFNASKSVSLAYTFANENDKKEILTAFQNSVRETMQEVESGMQARVRAKGKNENRMTANIAYGEFTHFTTRPIDGIPDPHLHSHCFVFNATFDSQDNKWKAGQFQQLKQDAPYYEAVFHSKLAYKLQRLGYNIERGKNAFELKDVEKDTIQKFSRRTKEIEDYSKEHNITDAEQKSHIGAKTREAKRIDVSAEKQETDWLGRLTKDELALLRNLKNNPSSFTPSSMDVAQRVVQFSLRHHLERRSVASDKEILAMAIKSSIGKALPEQVVKALNSDSNVIMAQDRLRTLLTTKEALQEEKQLILNARQSRNIFRPLNEHYQIKDERLNEQQRAAVKHALSSSHGIIIITGKAGVGKTTLVKEVDEGVRASGKKIYAFAPSSEASRKVLRGEGFENADTVAKLLQDKLLQAELKNQVILIDEAGMLSNKQMNSVFAIAKAQSARVILSGDTRQHNSVERGDALRILLTEAGMQPVTVDKIQRQKNDDYKEAVKLLSNGAIEKGFKKLDSIGAIAEVIDSSQRVKAIAEEYYHSAYAKDKLFSEVLVIAPTHAEGDLVTQHIRQTLKDKEAIGKTDREYQVLKNLQFTNPEKETPENYQPGLVIVCHQNIKGVKAGIKLDVVKAEGNGLQAKDAEGKSYTVPYAQSKNFTVYEAKNIAITKGDKIRLTKNGHSNDGKSLFNGTSYTIEGFDRQGNIKLSNGSSIAKDFGYFDLGYVSTSHSSQGKSADKVIIAQSSATFRASSMEQFYVSVSRGKYGVSIYTDDKQHLKHAVSESAQRMSATELVTKTTRPSQESNSTKQKQNNPIPPYNLLPTKINGYGLQDTVRTR